jgi:tungstate transport system substrate-binding protein
MKLKPISLILPALLLLAFAVPSAAVLRCASTTSTQSSGLFDYLLPRFEQETGIRVHIIAVGTGAALELGRRGDVDVVLVHAKPAELAMVEQGWFIGRQDIMYNDFVIIGPTPDPAQLKQAASAAEALSRIRAHGALFISRGDNSGTHQTEQQLWENAGLLPASGTDKWYLSAGQGMARTIRIAAQKQGYTLTDRATWYALKDRSRLDLAIVYQNDPALVNQYGVMAVNPERHPYIRSSEALEFIRWLTSDEGQLVIGSYSDNQGQQLFFPNALEGSKTKEYLKMQN